MNFIWYILIGLLLFIVIRTKSRGFFWKAKDGEKLSLKQLTTFLMIESPEPFKDPHAEKQLLGTVEYKTIGRFYKMIEKCILADFPGPYLPQRPQLLPPDAESGPRPFYSQNSSNFSAEYK